MSDFAGDRGTAKVVAIFGLVFLGTAIYAYFHLTDLQSRSGPFSLPTPVWVLYKIGGPAGTAGFISIFGVAALVHAGWMFFSKPKGSAGDPEAKKD